VAHSLQFDALAARQCAVQRVQNLSQESWTLLSAQQQHISCDARHELAAGIHLSDEEPVQPL
jgi:hypothetical protein